MKINSKFFAFEGLYKGLILGPCACPAGFKMKFYCLFYYLYVYEWRCSRRLEVLEAPGAGIMSPCELPVIGAGN